ncbi:MAG: hypothetical protein IT430_00045 [Phycisphaerales bacterium]|nr:hypothetical protein [Phycisphaerales bacterium]
MPTQCTNPHVDAAISAQGALGLKYRPTVIRDEAIAFSIAARTRAGAVMLGEGAFWVVCLADATRLERAGYEWAPRR